MGAGGPRIGAAAGSVPVQAQGQDGHEAFDIKQDDLDQETTLVSVQGELDLASAPSLKWALTDLLAAGVRRIVLDLSLVSFIDSTALGVLVGVHRGLAREGRLAIAGAGSAVVNIFELTGLDSTFEMFDSLEQALVWVRGSSAASG